MGLFHLRTCLSIAHPTNDPLAEAPCPSAVTRPAPRPGLAADNLFPRPPGSFGQAGSCRERLARSATALPLRDGHGGHLGTQRIRGGPGSQGVGLGRVCEQSPWTAQAPGSASGQITTVARDLLPEKPNAIRPTMRGARRPSCGLPHRCERRHRRDGALRANPRRYGRFLPCRASCRRRRRGCR